MASDPTFKTSTKPSRGGAFRQHWSAEVFERIGLHLLSFYVPSLGFFYVLTGPHPRWQPLLFLMGLVGLQVADRYFVRAETRQPPGDLPKLPFDLMLYSLFAMQVVTVIGAARLISEVGFFSLDGLVLIPMAASSSGFSIITAHELIHRREAHLRTMGRILMGLVMYEHFYTEHVRGHHVRVGTPEDPATARFGETFWAFHRRTIPAQLRSAWRLETRRLGDVDMKLWDRRILRSRVVHGLVAEWAFAFGILAAFGASALVLHLLRSFMALSALEAVNYFEHWGLMRQRKHVRPVDSWDTTSLLTLYAQIGLSRHADHHAYASRPFQQLRHWEESPKLPRGYPGMIRLVLGNNRKFQTLMTAELERRQLGPFAPPPAPRSVSGPPSEFAEQLAPA